MDNLFRPMYEEYFEKRSFEVSINSAAQQVHNNEGLTSTSSAIEEGIDFEESFAPVARLKAVRMSQYVIELLKKHGMDDCVSMSTPMAIERLDADLQGTSTDQMTYHRMIRGLMYLTTSQPDIAFSTFVCARYQAHPMVKHLKETQTMQDAKTIARALQKAYNF
ncbi:hypothetical protein Tco_0485099 [Tanacetum coccineum]